MTRKMDENARCLSSKKSIHNISGNITLYYNIYIFLFYDFYDNRKNTQKVYIRIYIGDCQIRVILLSSVIFGFLFHRSQVQSDHTTDDFRGCHNDKEQRSKMPYFCHQKNLCRTYQEISPNTIIFIFFILMTFMTKKIYKKSIYKRDIQRKGKFGSFHGHLSIGCHLRRASLNGFRLLRRRQRLGGQCPLQVPPILRFYFSDKLLAVLVAGRSGDNVFYYQCPPTRSVGGSYGVGSVIGQHFRVEVGFRIGSWGYAFTFQSCRRYAQHGGGYCR